MHPFLCLRIADDYKDEKRRITAAMLRRLEVEEWDKERMKHFYYGVWLCWWRQLCLSCWGLHLNSNV